MTIHYEIHVTYYKLHMEIVIMMEFHYYLKAYLDLQNAEDDMSSFQRPMANPDQFVSPASLVRAWTINTLFPPPGGLFPRNF